LRGRKIKTLRVLIIENQSERLAMLVPALEAAGCVVAATLDSVHNLDAQIRSLRPDVVLIVQDSPGRDTLAHLCVANRDCPRPIVMFTGDGSAESIRAATQAGVTSYVVDGLDPARIRPILDVAVSRFEAFQALHGELEQTRLELAERRLIDQAKARLIRQTGAAEPEVYREMRRAAMDRGMKLADIARQILQKT
jgi:response regulator NasT